MGYVEPEEDYLPPPMYSKWQETAKEHGGWVILRTVGQGVHFGRLEDSDLFGTKVTLTDAQRIWSWDSLPNDPHPKYTLSEVALHGVDSSKSNVSSVKARETYSAVIEIVPLSGAAVAALRACKQTDLKTKSK